MILILRCFLSVAKTVKSRRMSSTTAGVKQRRDRLLDPAQTRRVWARPSRHGAHSWTGMRDPSRSGAPCPRSRTRTRSARRTRHVALVVVVDLERAVEPSVTAGRTGVFASTDHQRDAVDAQHEVEALLDRPLAEGDLRGDDEVFRLGMRRSR